MSGTRKMDKFELEAFTRESGPGAAPASEGTPDEGVADLPARPFAPRTPDGIVDLPASPFSPRRAEVEAADLPAVPFSPRVESAAVEGDRPSGSEFVPGEWIPPQSVPERAEEEAPPSVEALRTRLTRKFVDLAESVTEAFADFSIGGGAWAVELTAPQGMSTGGGKQALQHLRMRPRRPGYGVLVVGTVNQVAQRAELRDFDHIAILHETRYRRALEISGQEWEQFLRKAEVVLNRAGIQSLRTPPPRELLDQRRSMQRISKNAVAALVVILLLAAVVLWRVVVTLVR